MVSNKFSTMRQVPATKRKSWSINCAKTCVYSESVTVCESVLCDRSFSGYYPHYRAQRKETPECECLFGEELQKMMTNLFISHGMIGILISMGIS